MSGEDREAEKICVLDADAMGSKAGEATAVASKEGQTGEDWRFDPTGFTLPRHKKERSALQGYYKAQNSLLAEYNRLNRQYSTSSAGEEGDEGNEEKGGYGKSGTRSVSIAVCVSFVANVFLFFIKVAAATMTGSMAVIASTVDSVLDLLAGMVIFFTMKMVKNRDTVKYPQGKTRLEPLGVVIFSCIMSVSMMGLVQESVTSFVAHLTGGDYRDVKFDVAGGAILGVTIIIKLFLAIYCNSVAAFYKSPSVKAYADDHRNDVLTNSLAILCAALSALVKELWWTDQLGAIILCIYVVIMWAGTAKEQIQRLTGISAPPKLWS